MKIIIFAKKIRMTKLFLTCLGLSLHLSIFSQSTVLQMDTLAKGVDLLYLFEVSNEINEIDSLSLSFSEVVATGIDIQGLDSIVLLDTIEYMHIGQVLQDEPNMNWASYKLSEPNSEFLFGVGPFTRKTTFVQLFLYKNGVFEEFTFTLEIEL